MTADPPASGTAHPLDRTMELAERALYAAIAALLLIGGLIALGAIAHGMVTDVRAGALVAVESALSGLLLVFIFVELLGAVRATIEERKLVAEPFLVVGIIAAIKGILVASLKAGDERGEELERVVEEIVGLGLVVLFLALAGFLVRRKEREPTERDAEGPVARGAGLEPATAGSKGRSSTN